MISYELLQSRFDHIWKNYPEPYKSAINERAKKHRIRIITDKSEIHQSVFRAGQLCGEFYFRLHLIEESELNRIIIHEIGHFYLEHKRNLKWSDFHWRFWENGLLRSIEIRELILSLEAELQPIEDEVCRILQADTQ